MPTPFLHTNLPRIAVSMGDPAGIGPEIILACANDIDIQKKLQLVCFGDRNVLEAATSLLKPPFPFLKNAKKIKFQPSFQLKHIETNIASKIKFGQENLGAGISQRAYLDSAIESVLSKETDALCTAPVTKWLVDKEAGPFTGHTGYLAKRVGKRAVMMLVSEILRVILVTEHVPLQDVSKALNQKRICETIVIAANALQKDFALQKPRLAVCALNPHAGENGLCGDEEMTKILPAVLEARELLKDNAIIFAPSPADSLFTQKARETYDAVICLYHDQALIPLKALSARSAINVTLGLPIIRTSPDHGTAYDIAGKGIADPSSLKQALLLAAKLVSLKQIETK